jgi:hypothetical protein
MGAGPATTLGRRGAHHRTARRDGGPPCDRGGGELPRSPSDRRRRRRPRAQHDASRRDRSPGELLSHWQALLGGPAESSGIGSVAYSLAPLPALGARVFAEAPLLPRMVDRPTPAALIGVLPVVEEKNAWRIDLALFEGPARPGPPSQSHRGGANLPLHRVHRRGPANPSVRDHEPAPRPRTLFAAAEAVPRPASHASTSHRPSSRRIVARGRSCSHPTASISSRLNR